MMTHIQPNPFLETPSKTTAAKSQSHNSLQNLETPNISPFISHIDENQLRPLLKELLLLIKEKDLNLKRTVEIGQQWLRESQHYQTILYDMQFEDTNKERQVSAKFPYIYPAKGSQVDRESLSHIADLERKNTALVQHLEDIEINRCNDMRKMEKEYNNETDKIHSLQQENEGLKEKNRQLNSEKLKHDQDLSQLALKWDTRNKIDHENNEDSSKKQINWLNECIEMLHVENEKLKSKVNDLQKMESYDKHLKEQLDKYIHIEADMHIMKNDYQQIQMELIEVKDEYNHLLQQNALPSLSFPGNSIIDNEIQSNEPIEHGTLFSEIDDQRQVIQHRHHQLHSEHNNLLSAYNSLLKQQKAMKVQLSHLEQVQKNSRSEETFQRLEALVGQLSREKSALSAQILNMKHQQDHNTDTTLTDLGTPVRYKMKYGLNKDGNDIVLQMRSKIGELTNEIDDLQKEKSTAFLVKQNDHQTIQTLERHLLNKDQELRQIKLERENEIFLRQQQELRNEQLKPYSPDVSIESRQFQHINHMELNDKTFHHLNIMEDNDTDENYKINKAEIKRNDVTSSSVQSKQIQNEQETIQNECNQQ